jgi:hypothetical protein
VQLEAASEDQTHEIHVTHELPGTKHRSNVFFLMKDLQL